MATPPPNEAAKLAILRQQLMDKIKQDQQYKQQTDRQYTVDIQPNPNWTPKKANGGTISQDAMQLALMNGGGKVPKVLYHGTGSDIKEFRPDTFFSDDPKIAGMYAKSQHRAVEGSGPNIMPVHANMENPFVFDEAEARRQGKSFGQMIAPHASAKHRHAEALRILKERGHDGVILKNFDDIGGRQNQYIVFDPRKVKSAIGNRGTYDPKDPDITKAKGGMIDVRPTVFDDKASRRNEKIEAAARALMEGEMKQKAYEKLVAKEKPVKPYDFIPAPATNEKAMEVLLDRQKQNWRSHENWPAGHRVGLRLDIPAYERHGVWVNSIHDESGGKDKFPTSYGPVSSVRNAEFQGSPSKGIKVATGEQSKAPFAKIMGDLEHIDEDKAVKHMQKYLNHPDYRQVGYDPRRHGDFYDRETMQPVTHSEHVVQIGPLVLAKKPKYGKRTMYKKGGKVTHAHHLEIEERKL